MHLFGIEQRKEVIFRQSELLKLYQNFSNLITDKVQNLLKLAKYRETKKEPNFDAEEVHKNVMHLNVFGASVTSMVPLQEESNLESG